MVLTNEENEFNLSLIKRLKYQNILFTNDEGCVYGYSCQNARFSVLELLRAYCFLNKIRFSIYYDDCFTAFEIYGLKNRIIFRTLDEKKHRPWYLNETEMMQFDGDVISNSTKF